MPIRFALITVAAALAAAAQTQPFEWKGTIAPGQTIEIKGVNGWIHADPSAGPEAQVTATKTGKKQNPADVRVEVVPHPGGITICAVYPPPDGQPNECKPGKGGHMNVNHNDVHVDFTVHVPAGVRFVGRTVNGDVEAKSLSAFAEAHTVNGTIKLSTADEAQADTVNGSIEASLGASSGSGALKFSSVNGAIRVDLPPALNAQVHASTVNGMVTTDFPLLVHGKISRRSVEAIAGSGGRELKLSTVNGSIHLGQRQM